MKHLVEFPLEEGGTIWIEVDETPAGGTIPAGRRRLPEQARQTFEEAISKIAPVSKSLINKLSSIGTVPDEIAVTFGFNVSAEASVVIASTNTTANFGVTLLWKKAAHEALQQLDGSVSS